jgi:PAS domain S-box-containing protein
VSAAIMQSIRRHSQCLGRPSRGQDHRTTHRLTARSAVAILAACVVLLLPTTIAAAPIKEVRRVLVFNDLGSISSPGFAVTDRAIFAGLEKSPYQIEFYNENLETTLFSDTDSQREFREWYVRKYRDRKPDVIIAAGEASIKFMIESHEAYFPNTPVIFCGSAESVIELKPDFHFTGVWVVPHPEMTLNAALQLQPGTRHVVVIGGAGAFDRNIEAIVKKSLSNYESKLEFTYLMDLTMPALLERLKHLPSKTVVLHTSIMEDAAGARFIDASQSVPMVVGAANAPVFVLDDVDLGMGTVGGNLLSWAATGQIAASMALRVLNGERPEDIPIVKSANVYMFDWRALRRWGFKESNLPPGSVLLYRQPGAWELYKWYIIGGISLILVQALLILGLLWQRARRRKVEAELVTTNERLRLAVTAGKAVGWDWDVGSGRDRWFGDLQTVFGIPSGTYSGQVEDFRRRIYPEDRELVWKAVAAARRDQKQYIAEFRVVRSDGTLRWIRAIGKFYYTANGQAYRLLGMAADITDRKRAEENLRESEERLSAIVASAMDAIIVIDEEQRIVLFNTAAESIFGCEAGEVIETTVDRFIPQRFRHEHSGYILRLGETGITNRQMGALGGLWALRATGEEFPIEASISQIETAGKKLFTVIIRDVTESRRAQEAVRESEERFRLVANTAPVLIWMSGPDKLCNYFNQPWLEFTGRSVEAELGNGWAEGVHPEDLRICLDAYTSAFDRRESFKMQYRLRRNDGEYRWVSAIAVPRFNPDGSFAGYIGSCVDVTERKMVEEALASLSGRLIDAQEEERKRIAREIHDDYTQRLAVLAMDLEELAEKVGDSPVEAPQSFHEIWNQIGELGADLHSLSHSLHSSTLESLGLVAGVKAFCEEFANQKEIQVDFAHENVPRGIPGDVALCLFRIAQEGLRNIKRHSGAERAEVRLEVSGEELHLSVTDRGKGFDANKLSTRDGIGIRSMEERLRSLGGHLEIDSRPMEGTRIDAWLPSRVASPRVA